MSTDPGLVTLYRTDSTGCAILFLPVPSGVTSYGYLQMLNVIDKNGLLDIVSSDAFAVLCK